MAENLVIVESPAKAKTITGFLGKEFTVKSCFGHIRDLPLKDLSVDVENNFKPEYVIPKEKKKIIDELKGAAQKAKLVWLATDEDREGEAISWHLSEALNLAEQKTRRIVFHEITKPAILQAVENPRSIDLKLVDAQQARRVLDRLVGYELSPVLWKKVKPALSAGRVQSVAVRLIVEREKEINGFKTTSGFKVNVYFDFNDDTGKKYSIKAELNRRILALEEAKKFMEKLSPAEFTVKSVEKKPVRRTPPPPFITSTLQQEASRKLGFSVAQTMRLAQNLYEAGKITYMRTDSVTLSGFALTAAKNEITRVFGPEYVFKRQYQTKSHLAQEAHEAIRPTYFANRTVDAEDERESKLYDLIWKRAIASQMKDAELEKTTIAISASTVPDEFDAVGEIIVFDGYLKAYMESTEEEEESESEKEEALLPPVTGGEKLYLNRAAAIEKFSQPPPRYTEASLVKKLEALGIGRPSTYAPIISTIQKRGYVVKETRQGQTRNFMAVLLAGSSVSVETRNETTGFEKNKLFPTDIGRVVNDFLEKQFPQIMDYHFTAKVEEEFDTIATGELSWTDMLREFYEPFHKTVEKAADSSVKADSVRLLGKDPVTGRNVYVRIGRFGPVIQAGEKSDKEKPSFASLRQNQRMDTITFEEALDLLKLPRNLGDTGGNTMTIDIGRFGPYIKYENRYYSIKKEDDPYTVTKERALEIIEEKHRVEKEKTIKIFPGKPDVKILKGKWGPYLNIGKLNYKLPRDTDPLQLTLEDCLKIAAAGVKTKKGRKKPATGNILKTR